MRKRGISPLIATILLIGLVVIMALLIFNWIGSVVEKQSEDIDKLIEFQMSNLEFDFDCENYSGEDKINILLKNEYNGPIDNFFVIYNDSTSGLIDVPLSAYESLNKEVTEKTSSFIEIVPQIEIDGELKSLTHKKILKSCINVQLAPECSDEVDNDGDGFFDYDGAGVSDPDAGCSDGSGTSERTECQDGIDNDNDNSCDFDLDGSGFSDSDCDGDGDDNNDYSDPDCVDVQDTSESGTISFSSCNLNEGGSFVLVDDISTSEGNCFVFGEEFDAQGHSIEIDCDGHTIDGNNIPFSYGLWVTDMATNIFIHDCIITGFERGLFIDDGAEYNTFEDIIFEGNLGESQGSGVVIGGDDDPEDSYTGDTNPPAMYNTFKNLIIRDNYYGLQFKNMVNPGGWSGVCDGFLSCYNIFDNIIIEDNDGWVDFWCLEDEEVVVTLINGFTTPRCAGDCCDIFGVS